MECKTGRIYKADTVAEGGRFEAVLLLTKYHRGLCVKQGPFVLADYIFRRKSTQLSHNLIFY